MKIISKKLILLAAALLLFAVYAFSQMMDLSGAIIISSETNDQMVLKSITVLKEEVEKRTTIQLPISNKWSESNRPIISCELESDLDVLPATVRSPIPTMPSI